MRRGAGGVTLSDVARHAGVSLATASRAINGSENRVVGEELRARVLRSADVLGYAPDANAQAMVKGATRTIGVAVHDLADPYFASIADGLASAAEDRELFLTLATTSNRPEQSHLLVHSLDSLRVRAMVLVGGRWRDHEASDALVAAIGRYRRRGGRVVAVGSQITGIDCVTIDNPGGAHALVEFLVRQGYRRPILLTGPERHSTAAIRAAALVASFKEMGVIVPPSHRLASDFTRAGGASAMRLALESHIDGDVVVATNDVMAIGAMGEAREEGIRIPDELAFSGFGDVEWARDLVPPLTTVRVPTHTMGRLALDLAIDGPGDGSGTVLLPLEVMARASTPRRD